MILFIYLFKYFYFSKVCMNTVMSSSLYQDFWGFWMLRVDSMVESSTSFEIAASSNFYLHCVGIYPAFSGKLWVSHLTEKCIKFSKNFIDFDVISRIQFCFCYFSLGMTESVDKTSFPYLVKCMWFLISLEVQCATPLFPDQTFSPFIISHTKMNPTFWVKKNAKIIGNPKLNCAIKWLFITFLK